MADEKNPETNEPKVEPKETDEVKRLKATIERLTAENAEKKRELQAKMTEQEKAEAERAEQEKALREELESYRAKEKLATTKATLLSVGFQDADASVGADAWVKGDLTAFGKTLTAFLAEHDKNVIAGQIKSTPQPPAGGASKPVTKDDLNKMSYKDRVEFATQNADLYNELTK